MTGRARPARAARARAAAGGGAQRAWPVVAEHAVGSAPGTLNAVHQPGNSVGVAVLATPG